MAPPLRKMRVMLSSRNSDLIPDGDRATPLSDVRHALQSALQDETFCGQRLLEVWINEGAGAETGNEDAWEACLRQVDEADVVVVIYNGHGGWTRSGRGIGICHAEMERAVSRYPWKVRLVTLNFPSNRTLSLSSPLEVARSSDTNRAFAKYIESEAQFRGQATDRKSLEDEVRLAIAKALSYFVDLGKREGRKGCYHLGSPLEWSRLSYSERRDALERSMREYLVSAERAEARGNGLVLERDSTSLFIRVHGVPAAFGVAEARDLIGRPQLLDHESPVVQDSKLHGPVHLVACHKSVTESQVVGFMGHPDLVLVQPPFGFFAADRHTFVQAFFLANCRDSTATSLSVQRMLEWLDRSGETERLSRRARSRSSILKATAKQIAAERAAETLVRGRKK